MRRTPAPPPSSSTTTRRARSHRRSPARRPITIPVVAITAAQGATLDGLIAGGTDDARLDHRLRELPVRHRRPDLGLQFLRPQRRAAVQAEHRRTGRRHRLDLPARAGRHRGPVRHLDVLAARRGRRGADPAGQAGKVSPSRHGKAAAEHRPTRRTGRATRPSACSTSRTARAPACWTSSACSTAKTILSPEHLNVGESQGGAKTFAITVNNKSSVGVTYDLSHVRCASPRARTRSRARATTSPGCSMPPRR